MASLATHDNISAAIAIDSSEVKCLMSFYKECMRPIVSRIPPPTVPSVFLGRIAF